MGDKKYIKKKKHIKTIQFKKLELQPKQLPLLED